MPRSYTQTETKCHPLAIRPCSGCSALIGLAGCIGADADCAALPTRIELTLTADGLTPSDPAVCRDRR